MAELDVILGEVRFLHEQIRKLENKFNRVMSVAIAIGIVALASGGFTQWAVSKLSELETRIPELENIVNEIDTARTNALVAIETTKKTAVADVDSAGSRAITALNQRKGQLLTDLTQHADDAVRQAAAKEWQALKSRTEAFEVVLRDLTSAVIVFDRKEGCPAGWTLFKDGHGRMIVGAGAPPNQGEFANDSRGEKLEERSFRSPGGAQLHELTIDEMPRHNHETEFEFSANDLVGPVQVIARKIGNTGHALLTEGGLGVSNTEISVRIGPKGSGSAHNNMPPYIALYFCKKA